MRKVEYGFNVRPLSKTEGGGFLIEYPQLPGCISDGETIAEAIKNGQDALESWLHAAKQHGDPIPKRAAHSIENRYNGKILNRVPKTLHARLAARAKDEGVSLNQLILSLVAEGLGRRTPN